MAVDALAELKAKIRARKGKPGFGSNVEELQRMVDAAEAEGFVFKRAIDGRFVTAEYAAENPETTYRLRVGA